MFRGAKSSVSLARQRGFIDVHMLSRANRYLSFDLPLKSSLVPRYARGSATATYSRSTTGAVKDNSGDYNIAAVNEARFQGARRIGENNYSEYTAAGAAIAETTLWGYLGERASTNEVRNNSAQGAVVGAPGTLPTNWAVANLGTVASEVVAIGTENGIDYVDIRLSGTTSTTSLRINVEGDTQIAAATNDVWSHSAFVKLVGGSLTNISNCNIQYLENDGAGALLATQAAAFTPTSAALSSQRVAVTATASNASTAYVQPRFSITASSGVAIDITLRIGWPQCEKTDVPTSPIRTTTAAVTRNADSLTYASAGNATEAQGTMYCEATSEFVRSAAGTARVACSFGRSTSTLFDIGLQLQRSASGRSVFNVINSTAQVATASASDPTASTSRRMAGGWEVNNSNVAYDGVIGTNDTACTMPTSLTTIYVGNDDTAASALNACVRNVRFWTRRLPDSQLEALA